MVGRRHQVVATFILVLLFGGPVEATPPCESELDRPPVRRIPHLELSTHSQQICGLSPRLRVLQRVETSTPLLERPDAQAGEMYLVENEEGQASVWRPVEPEGEQEDVSPHMFSGEVKFYPLAFAGESLLVERVGDTIGHCYNTPQLEVGATYLALESSRIENAVTPVISTITVRAEPFSPPGAPNIEGLDPEPLRHACGDHGMFVARSGAPPDAIWTYRWEVRDEADQVVQMGMGPTPYALGVKDVSDRFLADDLIPDDPGDHSDTYAPGARYSMTVRAVDWRGAVSPPTVVDFTFDETGDGQSGLATGLGMMVVGFLIVGAPCGLLLIPLTVGLGLLLGRKKTSTS